ncbi:MAG: FMN-binding protein, partial [Pseudomonadota bacterium]
MKQAWVSVVFMFLITLFFGSLVSVVKAVSEDRIAHNQAVKLQRIVLQVLNIKLDPEAGDEQVIRLFRDRIKTIEVKDRTFYIGYEKDGRTIRGYAFPVGGPGFWGPIYGLMAVDPKAEKVLGIAYYKQNETPGLGARITEKWFQDQFVGLRLHPIEGDKKIFYLKPESASRKPNELSAITGASRTSDAVASFLNRDLDGFLKDFWPSLRVKKG